MPPDYLRQRPPASASGRGQYGYASDRLREAVAAVLDGVSMPPGSRVLDYGCGDRPYRSLLPAGVEYIGADLPGNASADIELVDGAVPLPGRSCAVVLSNQVLEHVEEPDRYLEECRRLLSPGGSLVLSTHGVMYYHRDPEDYWRWTGPGLAKLLGDHGFTVVEMRGVLGLAAAALQIFQDATMWKVPRRLQRPYTAVMQRFIGMADRRYEEQTRVENCLTMAVLARSRAEGDR